MKVKCSHCGEENANGSKYCSYCGYELPVVENKNLSTEVDQLKVKKVTAPKTKQYLKTLLGGIVGFVGMFFLSQYLFSPSIDNKLAKVADELNKVCPINVDQYTILKNATPLPNGTLRYNYTLVGITKSEIQLDTLKKYFFPNILQNLKTSPDIKFFRENKITLKYYYTDKDGVFITEYIVKPEMYE